MDDKHYIGVDVGTGSARACVVNQNGDIIAVTSKDIRTWRPSIKLYVRFTSFGQRGEICILRREAIDTSLGAVHQGHLAKYLLLRQASSPGERNRPWNRSWHWILCHLLPRRIFARN
jgi:hypothetical protein